MRVSFLAALLLLPFFAAAAPHAAAAPPCHEESLDPVDRSHAPAGDLYAFRWLVTCGYSGATLTRQDDPLQKPIPVSLHFFSAALKGNLTLMEARFAFPTGTPVGTYVLTLRLTPAGGGPVETHTLYATVTPPPEHSSSTTDSPGIPGVNGPVTVRTSHQNGVLCVSAGPAARCTIPDGGRVPDQTMTPGIPAGAALLTVTTETWTRSGGPDTDSPTLSQAGEYRVRLQIATGPTGEVAEVTVWPAHLTDALA